jgi:CRISPR system Cascade subunit CasA
MDLITESWLPVVTATRQQKKISPLALWDEDILDLAYPRPDFQNGAWQFLIGLLQTAAGPENEAAWRAVWYDGMAQDAWRQALSVVAPAMQFGPQKPAFLQSHEPLEGENSTIAGLLIDAPGGNTLKLNKDHFIKRSACQRMCPHCAAIALFTVQTNSPAGGAGYRVGMRGGGPLTTLIVPEDNTLPLWKKLWLNVMSGQPQVEQAQLPLIFPWLTATRTSERPGNSVTPDNAHALQAYWGMPRRIEIDFSATQAGNCDLCGEHSEACLREIRTKNYGVQYEGWVHPLSPHRQSIKDSAAPWLAFKGQPGGLCYKDWLGLSLQSEDKFNLTRPAAVVPAMSKRRKMPATRLWCFGFDMDNAKARCWYQHRLPLIITDEPEQVKAQAKLALELANSALSLLKKHLKAALYAAGGDAPGDFSMWDLTWWQGTQAQFSLLLTAMIKDPMQAQPETSRRMAQWPTYLLQHMFMMFDGMVLSDSQDDSAILRRQLAARKKLEGEYQKLKVRKDFTELAVKPQERGNA